MSWNDATSFCAKLEWRLPSASEWEYACRAGTTTAYHYGSNSSASLGNFSWYGDNAYYANQRYPHQAGVKLPNAFGLHDMHGNVWEWCQDRWHDNYIGAPTNGLPWESGASTKRVFRGGGWVDAAAACRSAYRMGYPPYTFCSFIGFRPACSLR